MQKIATPIALIVGALLGFFGRPLFAPETGDKPEATAPEVAQLREQNAELKAQLEDLPSTPGKQPTAILPTDGNSTTLSENGVTITTQGLDGQSIEFDLGSLGKQMEAQQKKQDARKIAIELAELKARLNLNPDQLEAVRALLEARAEKQRGGIASLLGMAGGDGDEAELDGVFEALTESGQDNFESELLALLEGEQKSEYEALVAERRANAVEATASRELASLQSMFTLTPEQKDQAFNAFTEIAAESDSQPGGVEGLMEMAGQRQQRIDALEPILSPEQLELYKESPGAGGAMFLNGADLGGLGGFGNGAVIQSFSIDATSAAPVIPDADDSE